jgi:hypothetical protein
MWENDTSEMQVSGGVDVKCEGLRGSWLAAAAQAELELESALLIAIPLNDVLCGVHYCVGT